MAYNAEAESENTPVNIFARLFLVIIMMTLLIASVIFVGWLNEPGNFPFKKVELVNRLENQESKELQKIAAKALNGGFFSLNVDAFRAELLDKLPWLKSISVRKIWPDKLLIEIAEHKPVVRWQSANGYQLLSQEGIIFAPVLSDTQKAKFNQMALFSGPETSAKKVLGKCFALNENLKRLDLIIKQCGMNKRRTWGLGLTGDVDIKLGKENISQQLERFIQVFSGKLKKYISAVEYVDLRYANGFSVKWNTDNALYDSLQNSLPKQLINKTLSN